ncbi:glycosyltransferase [Kumtagia ephedrae]|uniref:Glycosyl transferase family 1 domain-containing protein n=1 Tax=Kumtagia ephedrae TaxID=2116701 RepID=A0A2P7SSA9_9HYPH|nr:glycosyltransferase [Mesorhizobium ephedrae]PSJ65359.1 hypothetical protein C7I84_03175 [Mesorhizobium ephedrae]
MQVINYTIYGDNPYHEALYSGLTGRYEPAKGDIDLAVTQIENEGKKIFHIHWEEHCLRLCATKSEARSVSEYFVERCRHFKKAGGKIVWTMHNLMPHELEHPDIFLGLRRSIVEMADRVLIHNLEALKILHEQAAPNPTKVYYLPHPSYLGVYEASERTRSRSDAPTRPRTVQAFGMVRRYKGLDGLLDNLPPSFTENHGIDLRISGQPLPTDNYAHELAAKCETRSDVDLDFRKVPSEEVPDLLRQAGCVVLPYERFLTSGVALLCLSVGAPAVAPDTPPMRELFPAVAHRLLYKAGDMDDFRRAIVEAIDLSSEERANIVSAYLKRAEYLRPERISGQLGKIYDALVN